MENLSKKADVDYVDPGTAKARQHLEDVQWAMSYINGGKVLAVKGEVEEIKSLGPIGRLKRLKNVRAAGGDWQQEYEHIRQVVDPYDAMSDTQVFGVEIPWEFWRR